MLRLIFAISISVATTQAWSQWLPPSPLKIEQPPQAEAERPNDTGPKNQTLQSPKPAEEAANDAQDRHEKASSDLWLIRLTGALAVIGALQLLAFTYQAAQLWRTVSSSVSGDRPYIYPGEPDTRELLPSGANAVYPTASSVPPPRITCTIFNVGRTPAVIKAMRGEIIIGETLPIVPKYTYSVERRGDIIARPDKETYPIPFDFVRNFSKDEIDYIAVGTTRIFFFGYFKYTDVFGYLVTKNFCFSIRLGARGLIEIVGGERYNARSYQKTPKEFIS